MTITQNKILLGVNIDHIATIRNARGGHHPCVVDAAILAQQSGADGITVHLREDRRHIKDQDLVSIKNNITVPLNLEMAANEEMFSIAIAIKPKTVCLVPEKRNEITTEGGLNVMAQQQYLQNYVAKLQQHNILVSLFIDANLQQLTAAKQIKADIVELHTGEYCHNPNLQLYANLQQMAQLASDFGLVCNAGHGLNYQTAAEIAKIPQITELNIGHFIIGESLFYGLPVVIQKMQNIINQARNNI